jgi:hypothetical protein
MGWNTNVVIARDRTIEQVLPLIPDVYTARSREIDFDEAASPRLSPNLAIGQCPRETIWDQDVVIFDPLGKLADNYQDWLHQLSRVHPVIVLWLSAVESTYGIALFDFTKERRRVRWSGKELTESIGSHPAIELDQIALPAWGCDETVLFELTERASGPSRSAVEGARYAVVEFG